MREKGKGWKVGCNHGKGGLGREKRKKKGEIIVFEKRGKKGGVTI
jgi:hypothetical protein